MQQPSNPYNPYNYPQQSPSPQPPQTYDQPYPPSQPYGQAYPQQPYGYTQPSYVPPVMATPDPLAKQRRRIAFNRGLFFGLVMALVVGLWVVYAVVPQIPNIVDGPALSLLQAIPVWFIYYFAGRSGARASGKVGSGVLTCFWATLWYLLADFIGFIVIAIVNRDGLGFGGFSLDITLAFIGIGIGALGASRSMLKAPASSMR